MQNTLEETTLFIKNSNQISESPKKESSQNIKMMSTKYCLNKPKLFKEFEKSSLFQQSKTTFNLHQYSQRYTYNERINSFEKENLNSSMKHFNIDKSMYNDFEKGKVQKISKQQIMKKKMPKMINEICETEFIKESKLEESKKDTELRELSADSSRINKLLSPRVIENKKREEKRLKVYNRKFIEEFPHKNEKEVLMSYIRRNPLEFNPIKLTENKKGDNLRKLNMSCRKLGERTNAGSKWNLSVQRLKETSHLTEEDEKYEKEKMKLRQEIFIVIDDEIKKLYDLISQLKSLGYVEEKISEWIWTYCENNKKFLQQVIFKPQSYRSSLVDCKVAHKLEEMEQTKENARKFKRVINNISIDIQTEDLSELTTYLEEIFISKQYFELKRIQNQIEDTKNVIKNNYQDMKDEKAEHILKIVNSYDENKKFKPLEYYEMLSFYEDAKRLESHFGKVKGLTQGNKKKFENLTDVEIELNRKIKEVEE